MIPLSLLFSNRLPLGAGIIICKLRNPSSSIRNETLMADWSARFACENSPKLYLRVNRIVSRIKAKSCSMVDLRVTERLGADEHVHHVPVIRVIELYRQ